MLKSKEKVGVLFVCLGNICRSPLAEGVFRRMAAEAKLDVEIDSAGTHAYHVGEPPDDRAVAAARRRGIDISGLRARMLQERDFSRFDLIVTMDRQNFRLLSRRHRQRARSVKLFMHFAGEYNSDVPDPYYGGPEGFEHALDLIERAAQGLVEFLQRRR